MKPGHGPWSFFTAKINRFKLERFCSNLEQPILFSSNNYCGWNLLCAFYWLAFHFLTWRNLWKCRLFCVTFMVQVFVVSPGVILSPALLSSLMEPGMKHRSVHAHGDVFVPPHGRHWCELLSACSAPGRISPSAFAKRGYSEHLKFLLPKPAPVTQFY